MKERIKELRKYLNLTQQEFADKLGFKRNAIANYETGRNNPSEAAIILICNTWHINKEWLTTGKGEMFVKLDRNSQIADWVGKCLTDESAETQRRLLKILSELPSEYWQAFADFGNRLAKEFSKKEEN